MAAVEGSKPTYKTIADFRKNNSAALKATHRNFLVVQSARTVRRRRSRRGALVEHPFETLKSRAGTRHF
jgi:hypothetical protein